MDIKQIEMAAEIVFAMCKEHPEICPHRYNLAGSTTKCISNKKITTHKYICGICGTEMTKVEAEEIKND